MSAEKYPCIFLRQMKAIVYLCLGKPQGNQNSIFNKINLSSKFSVLCYTEALEMVLNIHFKKSMCSANKEIISESISCNSCCIIIQFKCHGTLHSTR